MPRCRDAGAVQKKKPPVTYRYDSSLSPSLDWDGQNPAREQGENLLSVIRDQLSELREKLAAPGQRSTLMDAVHEAVEGNKGLLPLSRHPVAFVFGPENGAVSEKLVYEAAREAHAKSYTHLYVIGFAIQPNARTLVEKCPEVVGVPATYVQATPDLLMGDLLKNMRSSQIFSVCGLPEIKIHRNGSKKAPKYQVELIGLDVFDPVTMEVDGRAGNDVPGWFWTRITTTCAST